MPESQKSSKFSIKSHYRNWVKPTSALWVLKFCTHEQFHHNLHSIIILKHLLQRLIMAEGLIPKFSCLTHFSWANFCFEIEGKAPPSKTCLVFVWDKKFKTLLFEVYLSSCCLLKGAGKCFTSYIKYFFSFDKLGGNWNTVCLSSIIGLPLGRVLA